MGLSEALIEHLDCLFQLLLRDRERGLDSDGVSLDSSMAEEKALVECKFPDLCRFTRGGGLQFLVLDKFNSDHEA